MKLDEYNKADWSVCDKQWSDYDIRVAAKDVLPTSMQGEMEDKDKGYWSFPHEEWCDFLSTMEAKDSINWAADQIKILSASNKEPHDSESDAI